MKPTTLHKIRIELAKLADLYDALNDQFNGKDLKHGQNATYPLIVAVCTILRNMALNSTNCFGYSHLEAVEYLKTNMETLEAINNYSKKCYMTHIAYNEASAIIDGLSMSEFYEH